MKSSRLICLFTTLIFLYLYAPHSYSASICTKNLKLVESAIQRRNAPFYWAYGGFTEKVINEFSKVLQPCAASDPEAQKQLNQMQKDIEENRKFCRSAPDICRKNGEWGASESTFTETGEPLDRANQRAFLILQEEVQRVLTSTSNNQPTSQKSQPEMDGECSKNLRQAAQEINAADAKIPKGGATQAMGAVMCSTQMEATIIRRSCSDIEAHRHRLKELKRAYDQAETSCRQLSTGNQCPASTMCPALVFDGIAQQPPETSPEQPKQFIQQDQSNPKQNPNRNGANGGASQANGPQQSAEQAQQLALQNQARADQARQGKRRRHEPENEASQCIQPDFGGLYGGMKNTCDFKVWYTYCGYRPKENSWLTGMNCEKQKFGSDSVGPGRTSAAHTKGVEMLYWIACKEPAWTVDTEFVPGQGLQGRCHTVGGN